MVRTVFGVRIEDSLKKEFTAAVRKKGLSTCYVVEALLRGWLEGTKISPANPVNKSLTIAVSTPRVVKRVRRRLKEYVPEGNHYDPIRGWYFDSSHPETCIVEQPREWKGEDKGMIWNDSRGVWWKFIEEKGKEW